MTLNYAYTTNLGLAREKNEDNLWCAGTYLPENHLSESPVTGQIRLDTENERASASFCIFDGMGGEKRGETASYLAASCFDQYDNENTTESEKSLVYACKAMNQAICDFADKHRVGSMGSTAAMIRFRHSGLCADICNIGDSRIYIIRGGMIKQLSVDHVLHHPFTGTRLLTQSLGIDEKQMIIEPYTTETSVNTGDVFVICSDGLTDCCSDTVIQELVNRSANCLQAVTSLEKAALEQGAPDNITVIVCQIS